MRKGSKIRGLNNFNFHFHPSSLTLFISSRWQVQKLRGSRRKLSSPHVTLRTNFYIRRWWTSKDFWWTSKICQRRRMLKKQALTFVVVLGYCRKKNKQQGWRYGISKGWRSRQNRVLGKKKRKDNRFEKKTITEIRK